MTRVLLVSNVLSLLLTLTVPLACAAVFQAWTAELNEPPMVTEDGIDTSGWPQKNLIVAISSDRGLCGGENCTTTLVY